MRFTSFFLILFFFCVSLLGAETNKDKKIQDPQEIFIEADQVTYSKEKQYLKATGNVKIVRGDPQKGYKELLADKIDYDVQKDHAKAEGNVRYIDESGSVLFAKNMDLKQDFKDVLTEQISALTTENERFISKEGHRDTKGVLTLKDGIYSPCNLCKKENKENLTPFWQIKANKIVHDPKDKSITYYHVRLELLGVPIFYSPIFWHPDPSVKRKSGILTPVYGSSKNFGFLIGVPVYYVISQDRDVTITPVVTTKQGGLIVGEYRQLFKEAQIEGQGSFTQTRKLIQVSNPENLNLKPIKRDRWHFFGSTRIELNQEQLLTADIRRASDTTYLRTYPILNKIPHTVSSKNMVSKVQWEQYKPVSYSLIEGYSFQTDYERTTPIIFPKASYLYESEPDRLGMIYTLDSSALALSRRQGITGHAARNMQRIIFNPGVKLPYVTDNGQVLQLTAKLNTHLYSVRDYKSEENLKSRNNSTGRFAPFFNLDWRYPFMKILDGLTWLVEPIVSFFSMPGGQKTKKIPNEDSLYPSLDDHNLFAENRFDGFDRLDFGHRVAYGIQNSFYGPHKEKLSILLGQSMRLDQRKVFPKEGGGESDRFSDYVLRVILEPSEWVSGFMRLSQPKNFSRTRAHELGVILGKPILRVSISYVSYSPKTTVDNKDISQITHKISTEFSNWAFGIGQTIDFKKQGSSNRALSQHIFASYSNDCFVISTTVYKTSYRDRDLRPDTGVLLQFSFKNLGGLNFGSSGGRYIQPLTRRGYTE